MSSAAAKAAKLLRGFKKPNRFDVGLGSELPEAYKKFWNEWKIQKPVAVHYIPKEGRWERDEITGEVKPIQDIPIPVINVPESNQGIWGGESIVKGFQKRHRLKRRVPHFWVPVLRRSVVHSVILNQYLSVTVTDRTINLIHESLGFDHYILKTPACDLKSTLALTLKRKLLEALQNGCPHLADNPTQQQNILSEYKKYLEQYTPEEIEWYGLTFDEALRKLLDKKRAENPIVPHKIEFRSKLIEELRKANIKEAGKDDGDDSAEAKLSTIESSWISKINPFGKKQET